MIYEKVSKKTALFNYYSPGNPFLHWKKWGLPISTYILQKSDKLAF